MRRTFHLQICFHVITISDSTGLLLGPFSIPLQNYKIRYLKAYVLKKSNTCACFIRIFNFKILVLNMNRRRVIMYLLS